jgi:phosphoenolpyruvate phosphomutase
MGNKSLSRLLQSKHQLLLVGAHDALSGRLGERGGFDALWASGFEISAANGLPDANLIDMSVQLAAARQINEATSLPVIADGDNGYGNAVNAAFTARKFAAAGVAGLCIEDNIFPKRCSFYGDARRELVSAHEHALKVEACKDATGGELFLIARTEALIAGYSLEEALSRAEAYAEAGADAILIHSKQTTPDEIVAFARRWTRPTPLVAVPTTYDSISAKELASLGYRMVIFANHGLRAAIKAVTAAYARLLHEGRASALRNDIVGLSTVFDLVGLRDLEMSERKYLPPAAAEDVTLTNGEVASHAR